MRYTLAIQYGIPDENYCSRGLEFYMGLLEINDTIYKNISLRSPALIIMFNRKINLYS